MKSLLADFDILFNVVRCHSVDQVNRSWLEPGSKDYQLVAQKSKLYLEY
jgi:hypothetical protein